MKLVRWGASGEERPGLVDSQGRTRDLSGVVTDITAEVLSPEGLRALHAIQVDKLPEVPADTRLGAPVASVSKIVCVGLNYADHAAESGMPIPQEPVLFLKATTSLTGPDDDVVIPRGSEKTDWEVELGVVIGSRASYVNESDAMAHVAGYCVINDVSERAFQLERGGQWDKGKGCDTFSPVGPWLVTKDEIHDPSALRMSLKVNDRVYQNGSTATMIFGVAHLVSYISQFMTLLPGDIISTGTPPGVGLGQKPPVYLKTGDVMHVAIEGLGEQRQVTRAWSPAAR